MLKVQFEIQKKNLRLKRKEMTKNFVCKYLTFLIKKINFNLKYFKSERKYKFKPNQDTWHWKISCLLNPTLCAWRCLPSAASDTSTSDSALTNSGLEPKQRYIPREWFLDPPSPPPLHKINVLGQSMTLWPQRPAPSLS